MQIIQIPMRRSAHTKARNRLCAIVVTIRTTGSIGLVNNCGY